MRSLKNIWLLFALFSALGTIFAQTPARPAGQDLQVQLSSTVKAKNAKVGDVVKAVTVAQVKLSTGTVIPAGSKVVGHVRKVEADSADAHTSLIGISFEEIDLKKGQTVPLNCVVRAAEMPDMAVKGVYGQALEQAQSAPPMSMDAPTRSGSGPGAAGAGNGPALIDGANPYKNTNTSVQPGNDSPKENIPEAVHTGQVRGMPGVAIELTGPDHLSTFKSAHKNLELQDGLQLMLWVMQ